MHNHDLKSDVKQILLNHQGRDRAVPGRALAQRLGYKDDRAIRLVIRDLISEGVPIASTTESPAGYFVVVNQDEAEQYANSIKNRLIENAIRRRDFRRSASLYFTKSMQARLL